MLEISHTVHLDDEEIEWSAIRARGAGGQKVNKTSVAMHLRFDVRASSLPEHYKTRLLALKDRRITKAGVVVIKSQQHRSQEQNKEEALTRLAELIRNVAVRQKTRIATQPSKGAVKRRLQSKKQHAEKKQRRQKVDAS